MSDVLTTETWMPVSGRFRAYPLAPEPIDTEDGLTIRSKGHHDPFLFLAVARAVYCCDYGCDEWPRWLTLDYVEHQWIATRQGYGMTGPDGEYRYLWERVSPAARGAYPVTLVEW